MISSSSSIINRNRNSLHCAIALVLAAGATFLGTGCGLDGVVGGTCKPGYTEAGGQCVVSTNGATPTFDPKDHDPTTTPISSNPNKNPSIEPTSQPTTPSTPDSPTTTIDTKPPFIEIPVGPTTPPIVINNPPQELVCPPPTVACHGVCISVEDDARNCGACGRICPSNICVNRECVGATPGDIVMIGHEMKSAWNGSVQAKVLTNAVSIPTTDPIRILSFSIGGDGDNAASSHYLIAAGITRQTKITSATAEALDSPSLYADYDVVLMQGVGGDPATLGARWAGPLSTFTKKGGVFVALDDGSTDMPSLVNATGLITVGTHTALPSTMHFVVPGASDVVGHQLLSPYASFGPSVGFSGAEAMSSDVTWVVRTDDVAALPTVIHKIARY